MLAFLIKACVKAMQKFPEFNASIDGDTLVLKKYFNIGFAADTPNGLMVPVIKNAESKGVFDLARESGELARQARDGKLKPAVGAGCCRRSWHGANGNGDCTVWLQSEHSLWSAYLRQPGGTHKLDGRVRSFHPVDRADDDHISCQQEIALIIKSITETWVFPVNMPVENFHIPTWC